MPKVGPSLSEEGEDYAVSDGEIMSIRFNVQREAGGVGTARAGGSSVGQVRDVDPASVRQTTRPGEG